VGQFGKIENSLLQHNSEEEWDRKGDENFSSVLGESELEEAKYGEGYGRFRGCNKTLNGYIYTEKASFAVSVSQSHRPILWSSILSHYI
jgi:hypothetical protein